MAATKAGRPTHRSLSGGGLAHLQGPGQPHVHRGGRLRQLGPALLYNLVAPACEGAPVSKPSCAIFITLVQHYAHDKVAFHQDRRKPRGQVRRSRLVSQSLCKR